MNPKLFSVFLSAFFCVSLVRGSPVDNQSGPDSSKILSENSSAAAVTTVSSTAERHSNTKLSNVTTNVSVPSAVSNTSTESPKTSVIVPGHTSATITTSSTTIKATTAVTPNSTIGTSTPANDTISTEIPGHDITSNTTLVPPTKTTAPSVDTTTKTPTPVASTTPVATTVLPTSAAAVNEKDRGFDGPSFIGGIVLALGLTGIGFVAYKFCKARNDRNYRHF